MDKMDLESLAFSGRGDIDERLVPFPHSTICHCSVASIIKWHELPRKSMVAYSVIL